MSNKTMTDCATFSTSCDLITPCQAHLRQESDVLSIKLAETPCKGWQKGAVTANAAMLGGAFVKGGGYLKPSPVDMTNPNKFHHILD